jgi:hypothetical protein
MIRTAVPIFFLPTKPPNVWDALREVRNLGSPSWVARLLTVQREQVERELRDPGGRFLAWVNGAPREHPRLGVLHVDLGQRPGPERPESWRGKGPEVLLADAQTEYATRRAEGRATSWHDLDKEQGARMLPERERLSDHRGRADARRKRNWPGT